jgi:hypothetical protein
MIREFKQRKATLHLGTIPVCQPVNVDHLEWNTIICISIDLYFDL